MANAPAHRFVAATAVGVCLAHADQRKGQTTWKPLAGAGLAAFATNLPDILEPPIHPHHRQFFHSMCFAGVLGYGLYRLYQWLPEDKFEETLQFIALVAGSAYLIHLAMDGFTPRSLPLIGKFG